MKFSVALFSFLFAALVSVNVFAGTRDDAYRKVCEKLPFNSDKDRCIALIHPFTYFDNRALDLCAALAFSNDKLRCVGGVGGKNYADYEISYCGSKPFPSDKVNCLLNSGSPWNGGGGNCIDKQRFSYELLTAREEVRTGRLLQAEERMTYLINVLNTCPLQ